MAADKAAQRTAKYLQQNGLRAYIEDAARLLLGDCSSPVVADFLAGYMSAVATGQAVQWRHHAYVTATQHNRKMLLASARHAMAAVAAAGRLTLGDLHSLLLLLVPDLPAATVETAFAAATTIQTGMDQAANTAGQQQQQQLGPGPEPATVQLPVFLQCFEVVFFFESHLLTLRRTAFDADRKCLGSVKLDAAMDEAAELMVAQGWPVPPAKLLRTAVSHASRAGTFPDFAFSELVRTLCTTRELVISLRAELTNAAALAAAAAAAAAAS